MSTHKLITLNEECFFVTFTCYKKAPLIELSDAYASFYKWFLVLKSRQIAVLGYVIMPNHFHGIFFVPDQGEKSKTINQIMANGKRFIAYEIVRGLKERRLDGVLKKLEYLLTARQKQQGYKHRVFTTSSDIRQIKDLKGMYRVLDYIHKNPCQKYWNLSADFRSYPHSSALFYEENIENRYVSHFVDYF